jgi:uncharacterized membrane protein YfcA
MSPAELLLVLAAGIGAGMMNSVVGAGTLITFPVLLLLGLPPVVANVSNTIGLVSGSVAGAYGYRSTLVGRAPLVRRLVAVSCVGGIIGGLMLVLLPPSTFELVVPLLLVASAVLAALQPRLAAAVALRRVRRARTGRGDGEGSGERNEFSPLLATGVFATALYGGYFGAAQGVLLLVLLGILLGGSMNDLNGIKNVLGASINLVAALLFAGVADVDWVVAVIIAIGAGIGGTLGGRYGPRLPPSALRALIVSIALAAAVSRLLS